MRVVATQLGYDEAMGLLLLFLLETIAPSRTIIRKDIIAYSVQSVESHFTSKGITLIVVDS